MNLITLMDGVQTVEHTAAQAVFTKTSTIPWWGYIGVTLMPWILGMVLAISSVTYWKRINRAGKDRLGQPNQPIPVGKMFLTSILLGLFFGGFLQWGLQELVAHLTGSPVIGSKGVIVSAVFTGMFTPMAYELIRVIARKRGWEGLYVVLTVAHKHDDRDDSEIGDLTTITREDTIPKPHDPTKDYPDDK